MLLNQFGHYYYQLSQVAQCQLLMEVQLLGFENKKNLETRNTNNGGVIYCCCDSFTCASDESLLSMQSCPPSCDTFFNVKLQHVYKSVNIPADAPSPQ